MKQYGTTSQITFAISTCLLDNSAERWKRICFDGVCTWRLVIFILVRWLNLLTYFTKEATQTIHHFMQNCSRYIENYCFKHKNLVSCPLTPHRGLCPLDPRWGLRPQTHIIGLRSRARHGYVFDPHFSLPSAALASLRTD